MDTFIPVNQPDLSGNEKKYLIQCIETGWISSEGPFVKEFEGKFSQRIGRNTGFAVSIRTSLAARLMLWVLRPLILQGAPGITVAEPWLAATLWRDGLESPPGRDQ